MGLRGLVAWLAFSLGLLLVVPACSGGSSSPPPPPPSSLKIENQAATWIIAALYCKEASQQSWGSDLLGASTIPPGGEFTIVELVAGDYDVKAVLDRADCLVEELIERSLACVAGEVTVHQFRQPACAKIQVRVTGRITFDSVPVTASGLDYTATTQQPARGVVVRAVDAASPSVALDSTTTDEDGDYSLQLDADTDVVIRVRAQMLETGTPSWDFRLVDNTQGKALYVFEMSPFNTGTQPVMSGKNRHFSSGWDAGQGSYADPRHAAPFAILDVVYDAVQLILGADPDAALPELTINWSEDNVPAQGDTSLGQIGTSHFDMQEGELYILGDQDNDTDEYDVHVLAHEWNHYWVDAASRNDTLGGTHYKGDKLDPRVAFNEGFATAFSGMVTDDRWYSDTMGDGQGETGIRVNLESNSYDPDSVGWFSEASVWQIVYDLYDGVSAGSVDEIELGFGPIHDVMVGEQRTAESFATIFSFVAFLKQNNPGDVANINPLLAYEDITTSAVDQWDSTATETNDGGSSNALPVYTRLTVGGLSVRLCGDGDSGNHNKLGNRRFFYFTVTTSGSYSITADPVSLGDAVIILYSKGEVIGVEDTYVPGGTETLTVTLTPGTYVGEVFDYRHVIQTYTTNRCFDVSVD